jgi:hypothetical protein
MSTTPSALWNVERFDIGMGSPVFEVASDEEACARKGSATQIKATGKYILARSGPKTGES